MTRRAAIVLTAVLALAGCSSPPATPTAGTTSSPAAAPSSATPARSVAPSPTITTHRLGESVPLATVAVATVYSYRQPVAAGAPRPDQAGFEWGAADVKVCAGSGSGSGQTGIAVTHDPWAVVYSDATIIQPSSTGYGQFPQPEYPWGERDLAWGRCVRGWITFAVPAGKRPTMIEYQPGTGSEVTGQTVDWTVA